MLKLLHRIGLFLPYALFLVAGYVVHREVTVHPMHEVVRSIRDIPWEYIAGGSALTILNYCFLGAYDWLGIRYAGHKVPMRRMVLTAFISYAISNNTGHAIVSGTSVRYRFYTLSGVPGWDILKIAVFSALTFLIAAFSLEAGLSLFFPELMKHGQAQPNLVHAATLISAAALGVYWTAVLFMRGPVHFKNYEFRMPSPRLALMQTIIGVSDLIMASFILYLFLDQQTDIPFAGFLSIYVLALLAGIVSQVPGGLGVFEATFISLAGPQFSSADILSALVLFRIVYYFLPLVVAGLAMFVYEIRHHGERLVKGRLLMSSAFSQSTPAIFALLLFFAGAMLLITGAAPPNPAHIVWLRQYMPLAAVEISHILASLSAIGLLFVSRAVRLHLRAGWYIALPLLLTGAVTAFVRGIDWEEASILTVIFLMMLPIRRHFDRAGSVLDIRLTHGWAAMIAIIMIVCTWTGFFAYRHVEYANALWLHFSYQGNAARFLRALAVSVLVLIAFVCYRVLTKARAKHIAPPTADELTRARTLLRATDTTDGFLALLADKYILWSDDNSAFIAYAITPSYWIAMGDPVGNPDKFESLAWTFREMADEHSAQTVFYQVSERYLPLYLDLGLVMVKVGENARVKLAGFSLAGGKRENQRKNRNRFQKQGYLFRILGAADLDAAMPRLKQISDQWLEKKDAREKGFSLGFFDEDYIRRTRVGVIEKDGAILAFANFWDVDNKRSISVDLMRYAPEAPPNLMEYLFVEVMLWAQSQYYEWFGLGMAPLSGLKKDPLAPLWHKIGTVIFEHGEEFYNFEGLYAYKSKFDPEWQPRYLATPSGLRIPLVLMNITSVISGGPQGVFKDRDRSKSIINHFMRK